MSGVGQDDGYGNANANETPSNIKLSGIARDASRLSFVSNGGSGYHQQQSAPRSRGQTLDDQIDMLRDLSEYIGNDAARRRVSRRDRSPSPYRPGNGQRRRLRQRYFDMRNGLTYSTPLQLDDLNTVLFWPDDEDFDEDGDGEDTHTDLKTLMQTLGIGG